MKIDSGLKNVATTRAQDAKVTKAKARPEDGREQGGVSDNVALTSEATLLRSLESSLASLPDTDAAKVESVRQAITDGSFRVDEEVVAERLVENTMETLQHTARTP